MAAARPISARGPVKASSTASESAQKNAPVSERAARSRRAGRKLTARLPPRPRRDDDARGPQDLLAQPPARLDHGEHRALGDLGRRLRDQRLVLARVEDRALGRDLGQALAGQHVAQGARGQRHAAAQRLVDARLGERVERALEVVEHRQERAQDARAGLRGLLLGEPRLALLVVVEVGREPAQVVEVLVALALELRDPVLLRTRRPHRAPGRGRRLRRRRPRLRPRRGCV